MAEGAAEESLLFFISTIFFIAGTTAYSKLFWGKILSSNIKIYKGPVQAIPFTAYLELLKCFGSER